MVDRAIQQKILLTSTARSGGVDPRTYRRAAERGELVRVSRGAYLRRADWLEMNDLEKYASRVVGAALASRNRSILSHVSAAVLWGVPMIGPTPQFVHVLSSPATGTRMEGSIRRHSTPAETIAVEDLDGVVLTGFTRTVVEFVQMLPFTNAIVALDWALVPSTPARPKPSTTVEELRSMADLLSIVRGKRNLLRAIDFADPRAGSPGESLSRANIELAGLPSPELQAEFSDTRGRIGIVDFWWPDANLIGEFDGISKYVREEFTSGRTSGEVVIEEKQREDRLRATARRPRISRWGWKTANSMAELRNHLVAAGLPTSRRGGVFHSD